MNKTQADKVDTPTIQTLRETSAAEKSFETFFSGYVFKPELRIQVERTSR